MCLVYLNDIIVFSTTFEEHVEQLRYVLRQDPPLDLRFWSFLTFLHHDIEVERHLL